MTSQWYMNVNKARPRHAPTWRKAFKWTHFTTISKREWISTVIVYVYEVIWSIHFHSIKWNYDNRIGESPWRSWCYLICIITRGLCSYNARLFNHDVTAIGASYWRRREFPNYARLHRGRMTKHALKTLVHFVIDTPVTPALTLNIQIVNTIGDILATVKDFTTLMVTMMAADGQARWSCNNDVSDVMFGFFWRRRAQRDRVRRVCCDVIVWT